MDSAPRCLRAPIALLVAARRALARRVLRERCQGRRRLCARRLEADAHCGSGPGRGGRRPGTLSDADRGAIIETLRKYVIAATIDPLHGKPIGDLAAVFTPEATAALAGPDRAAAVDEGMPKAKGTVTATTPPVPIVALSDPAGAIDVVGTTLFLDVHTKAAGGPIRVLRTGELVLKRDAGAWKIASYRLTVNRTGAGLPAPHDELDGEERTMIRTLRRHPFVTATITVPLVMVLALAGGFMLWLNGVRLPYASGAVWFSVTKTAAADYTPAPDKPVFILALGNDGRPGDTSTRGDAIHLIGVNPALRKATILDFPRDTGLPDPGPRAGQGQRLPRGRRRRAAGPDARQRGRRPGPVRDRHQLRRLHRHGQRHGRGPGQRPRAHARRLLRRELPARPAEAERRQALAFARNRHQFPTGDLKRSENQGYLILQALAQLRAANTGPVGTLTLLAQPGPPHPARGHRPRRPLHARPARPVDRPGQRPQRRRPGRQGSGTRLTLTAGARELFADFADDAVLETH